VRHGRFAPPDQLGLARAQIGGVGDHDVRREQPEPFQVRRAAGPRLHFRLGLRQVNKDPGLPAVGQRAHLAQQVGAAGVGRVRPQPRRDPRAPGIGPEAIE
jgi:hypothetical protein